MPTYDKGRTIIVELVVKKRQPFSSLKLYAPDSVVITITGPNEIVKVDGVAMIEHTVGSYYYLCETEDSWATGAYEGKIVAKDGDKEETKIDPAIFTLQ